MAATLANPGIQALHSKFDFTDSRTSSGTPLSEWSPGAKKTVAVGSWGSGLGYPAKDLLGTADIESKGRSQGFFRTGGDTGVAEYAFGREDRFTLFHVCRNVDIHRAGFGAGTAIVAGLGIAGDFERGES